MEIWGEWVIREGREALQPRTYLAVCMFYLAVPELYPFIINQLSSHLNVSLSFVRYSKPRRGLWEAPIYSQLVRSTGDNLDL